MAFTTYKSYECFTAAVVLLFSLILFHSVGTVYGEALFLSHVPYDEEQEFPSNYEDDYENDIHDSITKLPGRHYRKLPYTIPARDPAFGHHDSVNHGSSFRSSGATRRFGNFNNNNSEKEMPTYDSFERSRRPSHTISGRNNILGIINPHSSFDTDHTKNNFDSEPRLSPVRTNLYDTVRRYPANPSTINNDQKHSFIHHPSTRNAQTHQGTYASQDFHSQNDEERPYKGNTASNSNLMENSEAGNIGEETKEHHSGPRFDRTMARNITVKVNDTAKLACRTLGLDSQPVSWLRVKDLTILTISTYRYSTDRRISIKHDKDRQEWLLSIRKVAKSDAGAYECQISTKPILSFVVNLLVVENVPGIADAPDVGFKALARIGMQSLFHDSAVYATFPGSHSLYISRGDVINITCVIVHPLRTHAFVSWLHDNQTLYQNVETPERHRYYSTPSYDSATLKTPESQDSLPNHPMASKLRTVSSFSSTNDAFRVNHKEKKYTGSVTKRYIQNHEPESNKRDMLNNSEHSSYTIQKYSNKNIFDLSKTFDMMQQTKGSNNRNQGYPHMSNAKVTKGYLHQYKQTRSLSSDYRSYRPALTLRNRPTDGPGQRERDVVSEETTFHLLVGLATEARAGKYTCRPLNGREASIDVHVTTELAQTTYSHSSSSSSSHLILLTVGIFTFLKYTYNINL